MLVMEQYQNRKPWRNHMMKSLNKWCLQQCSNRVGVCMVFRSNSSWKAS